MYSDTIDFFADTAAKKARAIAANPLGFFIACMLAGAYIGLAIIAITPEGFEGGADPRREGVALGD